MHLRSAFAVFVIAAGAPTQETPSPIARAQARLEAGELQAALDLLLPLAADASGDQGELARLLQDVAGRLEQAVPNQALRGFEAALLVLRRVHGEGDHASVAISVRDVAGCLETLGRLTAAIVRYEEALAMQQRLAGGREEKELAITLNNFGSCLREAGRTQDGLPHLEQSLAMRRRLYGEGDHNALAVAENNLGLSLLDLGRAADALSHFEASLAMRRRLARGRDTEQQVTGLVNVAMARSAVGREAEAMSDIEQALAMSRRLHPGGDHASIAHAESRLASSLRALGQNTAALSHFDAALAMYGRLLPGQDRPTLVTLQRNRAVCLHVLGRNAEALAQLQAALAMAQRMYGGRDHPDVSSIWQAMATTLVGMGRSAEALAAIENALTMARRLQGGQDHPLVARCLNDLGFCLDSLGRTADAAAKYTAALEMVRRLDSGRESQELATSSLNLAGCLLELDQKELALAQFESTLAMVRRLHDGNDSGIAAAVHSFMADCLEGLGRRDAAQQHVAACLAMNQRLHQSDHQHLAQALGSQARLWAKSGRYAEALPLFAEALAMLERLHGGRDHPTIAHLLTAQGRCFDLMDRQSEALAATERAADMTERLLAETRELSQDTRRAYFDSLKDHSVFEQLQALYVKAGDAGSALQAAERSRGRDLLDLLEQQRFEPLDEAERRAVLRGDTAVGRRIVALRQELAQVEAAESQLLHRFKEVTAAGPGGDELATLRSQGRDLLEQRKRLLDERARLVADILPLGRPRSTAEIQAALQPGELLLEYTVCSGLTFVYVVPPPGTPVRALTLPSGKPVLAPLLDAWLAQLSRQQLGPARGREPDPASGPGDRTKAGRALFTALFPHELWQQVKGCRRVWIAGHHGLHRLPFDTLVTSAADAPTSYWLDNGPPAVYVPSGSALHWLRQRTKDQRDDVTALDLLAIGDPQDETAAPELPEQGVLVAAVTEGSSAALAGILSGDVLLAYDARTLADDTSLRAAQQQLQSDLEDGKRERAPVAVRLWRRGETLAVSVPPGPLGVQVGRGSPRLAAMATRQVGEQLATVSRSGDLERLGQLPPLRGARSEVAAIAAGFADERSRSLLGNQARESVVRDLAAKARFVHFACHGIAEEFAGQSMSLLVLSRPALWLPGDDGHLKLEDLFSAWRGRMGSCQLVVLSACRTYVGPQYRDEAPAALPLGFLFAGASSVISSLWAVDDASTATLMTDFYQRLRAGETDRLAAFTAARKALRARQPDPFHWAPFLFLGAP